MSQITINKSGNVVDFYHYKIAKETNTSIQPYKQESIFCDTIKRGDMVLAYDRTLDFWEIGQIITMNICHDTGHIIGARILFETGTVKYKLAINIRQLELKGAAQ